MNDAVQVGAAQGQREYQLPERVAPHAAGGSQTAEAGASHEGRMAGPVLVREGGDFAFFSSTPRSSVIHA